MPIATVTEARDYILDHFRTHWEGIDWDNVFGQIGSAAPAVRYEDVKWDQVSGNWVWVSVKHADPGNSQQTLGQANGRRYRDFGIVTIQVFCPLGQGLKNNDKVATVARDIFRGKSAGNDTIEFRTVAVKEIGEAGKWYQTNVTAVFTYDSVF